MEKCLALHQCRKSYCIHNVMVSVLFSFTFTVLINCYSVHLYIFRFFFSLYCYYCIVSLCICSNYMFNSMNYVFREYIQCSCIQCLCIDEYEWFDNTLNSLNLHYTCLFTRSIILYLLISKKVVGRFISN